MRALFQNDRTQQSFFHEGHFLKITQAVQTLAQIQMGRTPEMVHKYNYAKRNLPDMLEQYGALPAKQFPVVRLRHVTTQDGFLGILQDGKIDGSYRTFLLNHAETPLRVSCWGVHIPPKKLEAYRKKRFAQFMQLAAENRIVCDLSPEQSAEVKAMLADSPALIEDSRYGNFQFSFSTRDLLAMYREQHCGGWEPVLRILGTEAYKQELVHWILVHSPDWREFDHLPMEPLPCTWNGTFLWTPKSMTDIFIYHIANSAVEKKSMEYSNSEPKQTYDPWIWDNIVFAFHLPGDRAIQISHHRLLENVQAVETAKSLVGYTTKNFLRHPTWSYKTKEHAQNLIELVKGK